jgi:hypothetical protein
MENLALFRGVSAVNSIFYFLGGLGVLAVQILLLFLLAGLAVRLTFLRFMI